MSQVPHPAPTQSWNVLAIIGFVLSLLGFNIIAIVLGFIALSQIKRTGEKGRGLAIAAIIIGAIAVIIFVIVLIVVAVAAAASGGRTY